MTEGLPSSVDVSISSSHSRTRTNTVRPQKHPKNAHAHRKMASLTARNRLFHDIVPDFRDRPAMENRVRFSYAFDAIPDMVKTFVNVTGHMAATVLVAEREPAAETGTD